eukprot:m.810540 g.810540  ORF g.810540 m.810540 type:complete len:401 (+) comp23388_c0_seq8:283-1485(+)
MLQLAAIQAALLLLAPRNGGASAMVIDLPQFTWATLPLFFHSQNESGRWNDAALKQIARFPLVTIEKAHGCGQPSLCVNGSVHVEENVVEACAAIHKISPGTKVLFYSNSVLDYKMFLLHQDLLKNSSLRLKNSIGTDLDDNGLWVYNLALSEMRTFHREDCLHTAENGCDGCYLDKANDMSQVSSGPAGKMSPAQVRAFRTGHMELLDSTNAALTQLKKFALFNNPNISRPGTALMLEDFGAAEQCIVHLQTAVRNGFLVEAHAGDSPDGSDNFCADGMTNSLAAFLIGAGDYSYYHCSSGMYRNGASKWSSAPTWPEDRDEWLDWSPEFDRPLGAPRGEGVKDADGIWRRSFASGTVVLFDAVQQNGTIAWGDGVVQRGWPNATSAAAGHSPCTWSVV